MTTTCPEVEPLLVDAAAGCLDGEGERRLAGHLAACLSCRVEAGRLRQAVALATVPPPPPGEVAAVAAGAPAAAARWRSTSRRRRVSVALAIAASLVAVAVPRLASRPPATAPATSPAQVAASADEWEVPDVDQVWSEAGVIPTDEPSPEVLFAELQEIDLDEP